MPAEGLDGAPDSGPGRIYYIYIEDLAERGGLFLFGWVDFGVGCGWAGSSMQVPDRI